MTLTDVLQLLAGCVIALTIVIIGAWLVLIDWIDSQPPRRG